MAALTGDIDQVPPAYSAVKVGGEKLYSAARRGEPLEAPPRRVRVEAFDLSSIRVARVRLRGPLSRAAPTSARSWRRRRASWLRRAPVAAAPNGDRAVPRRPTRRAPEEPVRSDGAGRRRGAPAGGGADRRRRPPRPRTGGSWARRGSTARTACTRRTERSSASTATRARRRSPKLILAAPRTRPAVEVVRSAVEVLEGISSLPIGPRNGRDGRVLRRRAPRPSGRHQPDGGRGP